MTRVDEKAVLEARLAGAERARALLEAQFEERSRELFLRNQELERAARRLRDLYRAMPSAILVVDQGGRIETANRAALRLLGYEERELLGAPIESIIAPPSYPAGTSADVTQSTLLVRRMEQDLRARSGERIPVMLSTATLEDDAGELVAVTYVAQDLRDRRRLEVELRHAQKLEAVGQLAAGIAHEINTPVQFVSDSVRFLDDAFRDLLGLVGRYRELLSDERGGDERLAAARSADEEADLEYLLEHAPRAFARTVDGLGRIAGIVRAMKDFAHPDRKDMRAADLARAVDATLVVSRNEWKYVARVETDLAGLPPVVCHIGDLSQVFLNLIVNAAHAIADAARPGGELGLIRVAARQEGEHVVVSISDDGCGIPPALRARVFEPFFTTKEVGRGTGQGLSLARTIVLRHAGVITFESTVGRGTTFNVRLPIAGPPSVGAST